MEKIFVNIASFRDPECQATLEDLFTKASHPERIFAGICLQIDTEADTLCFVQSPRPQQTRIMLIHYKDSMGANWARAQAQQLCEGEEYTLQIDSHMRFEQGWDEMMVDMLSRCPTDKAVLSTYIPRYTPPDNRASHPGEILRIAVHSLGEPNSPQLIHLGRTHVRLSDEKRSGLYPSPFCIATFIFTRSETFAEIPFDPHIQFWGDEITLAARLWTHGYNIFQPDKQVLYHYWRRDEFLPIQPYRSEDTERSKLVYQRVNHLLRFEPAADIRALSEIEKYSLGAARPLDTLWQFAGIDIPARQLSEDANKGIWNTKLQLDFSPEYQENIANKTESLAYLNAPVNADKPRIFVNIASYRDPECQWTVKDLFEKASDPERIFVGICWQLDEIEDKHCFEISTRPEQVRVYPVDWREAEGVCWARMMTQQLWDGEEYTLMIDSHMRFVQGWDELMLAELAACNSPKPVLSSSPAMYVPPDNLSKVMNPTVRRIKQFMSNGDVRCQGELLDTAPEHPLRGAFLVANFVFSRSEIIAEVPYDPYLYFDQEEISYATRLYTHGWDIFHPTQQMLYHFYNDKKIEGIKERNLHWEDLHKQDAQRIEFLRERSAKRLNHMTGYQHSYGWGTVRTLAQFEEYSGVDFKNKVCSEKALQCLFIKELRHYRKTLFAIPEMGIPARLPTSEEQTPYERTDDEVVEATEGLDVLPPELNPRSKELSVLHPLPLLEQGDFFPFAQLPSTEGGRRGIEIYAGKHLMLFCISVANMDYLKAFMSSFTARSNERKLDAWPVFVLDTHLANAQAIRQELGTQYHFLADPEHRLLDAIGIVTPEDYTMPPTAYVLSPNLRVLSRRVNLSAEDIATTILDDCGIALATYGDKYAQPKTITELPPGVIVPNVLTPEFCNMCIEAYNNGLKYEGTVGGSQRLYQPHFKSRTDHIVTPPLLYDLDEKLSRSLLPELQKLYGFEITHRENYKIGHYSAEKGGVFKPHRDNFEQALGYRRIAVTIQLNDDYEGGGLRFPEYGEDIYRPPAGAAIAFSCATHHEALKITKGSRYIIVCFFHGLMDEVYRRQVMHNSGKDLQISQFTPVLRRSPNLRQSRDFYNSWAREKVICIPSDVGKTLKGKIE